MATETTELVAGPELDRRIWREVMGHGVVFVDGFDAEAMQRRLNTPPPYSTDIAATYEMEAEIERRGIEAEYCESLCSLVQGGRSVRKMWPMIHATPEQRCRAALATVTAPAR